MTDRLEYLRNCTEEQREDEGTQAEYLELEASKLKIERIGALSSGIDGTDAYFLVSSNYDELDYGVVEQALLPRFYKEARHAGDSFCTSLTVTPAAHVSNACIVIFHHRYDV